MSERQKHESTLKKILRRTFNEQINRDDQKYAQKQLKKIYSDQFAKMLNDKKYEVLFEKNKQKLDESFVTQTHHRAQSISKMQEKSVEKRQKLLKDRVKLYQNNDKKWTYKTQQIKRKFKTEQKQMLTNAEIYRQKWEKEIQKREIENIMTMKYESRKGHVMFNSNWMSTRSSPNESKLFNQQKFQELTKKRKSRFSELKKPKSIQIEIKVHQTREKTLSNTKSNENYSKLVNKLQKMQEIDLKREKRMKTESLERAKQNLNKKIYKNNKPEIGSPCSKYTHKQEQFRIKTLENERSRSRTSRGAMLSYSGLRSSQSFHFEDDSSKKNQKKWLEYCQKTRRLKLNKLLKMNVRTVLNTQYKRDQKSNFIS